MLYTVMYERDGKPEIHNNLTKAESDLLASYIRKTFRKEVTILRQDKVIVKV